ncbi:MAG: hypothetical protein LWY06_05005 [Firmicutes bacterium]|nr:hypothetical protein [Bacillota bacterium]
MVSTYAIPLDRGYASGNFGPDIPAGFWLGKNMIYREDGALRCRHTYKIPSGNKCGPSGTNIIEAYPGGNIIAISSSGKAYYRDYNDGSYWNECTWTGSGGAPLIGSGYRGFWGILNQTPVYTNRSDFPYLFTNNGTSFSYLAGGESGAFRCYFLNEHQNRLLLARVSSNGAMISYSDVDDINSGYTGNYVFAGESSEEITGIHNLGGNMIILREKSIWAKLGSYSKLTSDQFQPVARGISSLCGSSASGRNSIYFADVSGIIAYSGGEQKKISTFSDKEWNTRSTSPGAPNPRLSYWHAKDWLWLTDGQSYEKPMVYDAVRGVWYRFTGFSPQCFTEYSGKLAFGMYGAANCEYLFEYGIDTGETGAVESTILQELQTPFLNPGTPYGEKYLKNLLLDTSGVDKIEIYLRNNPSAPDDFPNNPQYTIYPDGDESRLYFDSSVKFREISIRLTGSGKMIIKSIAVQFEERR